MKVDSITQAQDIFKNGSTTYFYSSLFFPDIMQQQVSDLYAFVRVADNYVDQVPQDQKGFKSFVREYSRAMKGDKSNNPVIDNFVRLSKENRFDPEWTKAFLNAMESDLTKNRFKNLKEVEHYMYGSAEVIGLYLSRILKLDLEADPYARMLGKAMQYINFIRDIAEDIELGRIYMPQSELRKYGIATKEFTEHKLTSSLQQNFQALVHAQIERYYSWQNEAEKGFEFIPKRYLIPIKTASEMYKYTAWRIYKNPQIIFEKKVKPSKRRIFSRAVLETLRPA